MLCADVSVSSQGAKLWTHPVKHWNRSIQLCQVPAVSQVHEQAKGVGIAGEEKG